MRSEKEPARRLHSLCNQASKCNSLPCRAAGGHLRTKGRVSTIKLQRTANYLLACVSHPRAQPQGGLGTSPLQSLSRCPAEIRPRPPLRIPLHSSCGTQSDRRHLEEKFSGALFPGRFGWQRRISGTVCRACPPGCRGAASCARFFSVPAAFAVSASRLCRERGHAPRARSSSRHGLSRAANARVPHPRPEASGGPWDSPLVETWCLLVGAQQAAPFFFSPGHPTRPVAPTDPSDEGSLCPSHAILYCLPCANYGAVLRGGPADQAGKAWPTPRHLRPHSLASQRNDGVLYEHPKSTPPRRTKGDRFIARSLSGS